MAVEKVIPKGTNITKDSCLLFRFIIFNNYLKLCSIK